MKAYIYQAALLCEGCAHIVKTRMLDREPGGYDAFKSEDSDRFPQGPYSQGGGEADCPNHCDHCRVFLENPLTADGADYVKQAAEKYTCREVDDSWSDVANRADKEGGQVVAEWIRFYLASGM
jgi:hypothetical protein